MNRSQIKTHTDAIVYFFESFDIEMIDTLLVDGEQYCGLDKAAFLEKINEIFKVFIIAGNTRLIGFREIIDSDQTKFSSFSDYYNNSVGYSFVGNNSSHFLDLMFIEEKGIIKSVLDCGNLYLNLPDRDDINRLSVEAII